MFRGTHKQVRVSVVAGTQAEAVAGRRGMKRVPTLRGCLGAAPEMSGKSELANARPQVSLFSLMQNRRRRWQAFLNDYAVTPVTSSGSISVAMHDAAEWKMWNFCASVWRTAVAWMDTREKMVPGMSRICDMGRDVLTKSE